MPSQTHTEQFVQQLTGCQTRLYAYIALLLGDTAAANDVLQETNLVLWRKVDEFTEGTDFNAWACSVARFQVMAYLRDVKRDRHLFDESIVSALVDQAELFVGQMDARRGALRLCLERLTSHQRELVGARYTDGKSIDELAAQFGRSAGSAAMALSRIRHTLFDCIRQRLLGEQRS